MILLVMGARHSCPPGLAQSVWGEDLDDRPAGFASLAARDVRRGDVASSLVAQAKRTWRPPVAGGALARCGPGRGAGACGRDGLRRHNAGSIRSGSRVGALSQRCSATRGSAGIIGAGRSWTVAMISVLSIPRRYRDVIARSA